MPKAEDTARVEVRKILLTLHDAMDQPPLLALHALVLDLVLDLLSEYDVPKRAAARDRLAAILAELGGRLEP